MNTQQLKTSNNILSTHITLETLAIAKGATASSFVTLAIPSKYCI